MSKPQIRVTIEGLPKIGKTSLAYILQAFLSRSGLPVQYTDRDGSRQPSGSEALDRLFAMLDEGVEVVIEEGRAPERSWPTPEQRAIAEAG